MAEHRLCHADELAEARTRGFDPRDTGTDTVILLRWQGRLRAWANACPHIDGAPMAWRRDAYMDAQHRHIACHAHGALFRPDSGLCVQGPCRGQHLRPLPLRLDEAGGVWVDDAPASPALPDPIRLTQPQS